MKTWVSKKKGFTLIELLVVTTIIIVLMSIGIISYQAAKKKGRDSKRKSDLEQVRAALEMYRSDYDQYPAGNWSVATAALVADNYLGAAPEDPKSSTYQYVYSVGGSNLTYSLYAYMEIPTGDSHGGTDCGVGESTVCNYRVVNP